MNVQDIYLENDRLKMIVIYYRLIIENNEEENDQSHESRIKG